MKGVIYEPEIQQVTIDKNKRFKIEKILGRKKEDRKKLALVKWLGWPSHLKIMDP